MDESTEKLKYEISELQKKISDLSVKNEQLRNEKYTVDSLCRELKNENEKLLNIVENLSMGFKNIRV